MLGFDVFSNPNKVIAVLDKETIKGMTTEATGPYDEPKVDASKCFDALKHSETGSIHL